MCYVIIPLRKSSPIFRLYLSFSHTTQIATLLATLWKNSPTEIEPGPMSISRHHPLLDFNTFATLGIEVCGAVARNLAQMCRYEAPKYSNHKKVKLHCPRERPHKIASSDVLHFPGHMCPGV